MQIIGIVGPMGVGKTTLAELLVKFYGFERTRFAGSLKAMLVAFLIAQGISEEDAQRMVDGDLKEVPSEALNNQTPRWAMQSLGTEWGRKCMGPSLWLDAWGRQVASKGRSVVVDDCRFVNEAEKIRELGGKIVLIERQGCEPGEHASEREYLRILPDVVFKNPVPAGDDLPMTQPRCLDEMIATFAFAWFSQTGDQL